MSGQCIICFHCNLPGTGSKKSCLLLPSRHLAHQATRGRFGSTQLVMKLIALALLLLLANGCVRPLPQRFTERSHPTVSVERLRRDKTASKVKHPESWQVKRAVACKYSLKNCRVPDQHDQIFRPR